MIRLRAVPVILGTLAIAGVLRTVTAVYAPDEAESFLIGAANAAGGDEKAPVATPAPAPLVCETPEDMLEALSEERDLLVVQKERLLDRETEVELATEKMRIEQDRLTELKQELESLLNRVEQSQTDDLNRLVALYSAMKPKEAAAIMNDMDMEVTVLVLAAMPERDAAPIMAQLRPVRARAISRIILERSKLPGDQRLDGLKL